MKKVLIIASIFLMVFALLVGTAMADTAQEQLIDQIREEPISVFTYLNREISIYEEKLFAVTMGKYLKDDREDPNTLEFEPGWFFGIEAKLPEWPKGTDLGEMFSKLRPQVVFHQGNTYFGLSYKFRNKGGEIQ